MKEARFLPMEKLKVGGKKVLLRVDINSPIEPGTKKIVNTNRIEQSAPTVRSLLDEGAKLALIAHQGDTLDYQNLISLEEHAAVLGEKVGRPVDYIDDVCGPSAIRKVEALQPGQAVLLGNLRYLTEEVSVFEEVVPLSPRDMVGAYHVRRLAPLFDYYINDAFSAAHRNAPSIVAFQELLPSAAGPLLFREVEALSKVMSGPRRPSVFLLGGAKISDAFGMLQRVLEGGVADTILTCGVTGQVMLIAAGYDIGGPTEEFLRKRKLDRFIGPAKGYLRDYPERIRFPLDLAFADGKGDRGELKLEELPASCEFFDIGSGTIEEYTGVLRKAGTIFINGPAGVFEDTRFSKGTKILWKAAAESTGYSVVGGGDSVSAAERFTGMKGFDYICTAGGAMVRFVSGKRLPLIEAMERSWEKWKIYH